MNITHIAGIEPGCLASHIINTFQDSRFVLGEVLTVKHRMVSIKRVRLRKSKEYCGNHAKACERPGKKERKGTWLEGADWVEFNDRLNNLLDSLNVSAQVASAKGVGCIIRKGAHRRVYYWSDTFVGVQGNGEWRWNYDEATPDAYMSHSGSPEPHWSKFPPGTPGIHEPLAYDCVG